MKKRITTLSLLLTILLTGCEVPVNSENGSSYSENPSIEVTSSENITSGDESSTSRFDGAKPFPSESSEQPSTSTPTTSLPPVTSEEPSTSVPAPSSEVETGDLPQDVVDYYIGVDFGLKGTNLKSALYNKIKGHKTVSYDSLVGYMKTTDRDWNLSPNPSDTNPYMVLIYGTYNFKTSTAKKHSTVNDIWDKEHIWAKSHGNFGTSQGAGSDLHHLRTSDKYNNNNRGNLDFGRVDNLDKWVKDNKGTGNNAGKIGYQNGFSSAKVYEPMDIYKGDVARAIFYMATRYSQGSPTLNVVNQITGLTGSPGSHGILSVLLEWNKLDPVDEFEFNRNGLVQDIQNNRNPFIDYPWLADAIWA